MSAKPFIPAFSRLARGFSLIELMVTVALIAVLMAVAVPSLRSYLVNNQLSTVGNEFVLGTMYARATAISTNRCVTMCITANPNADTPVCAASGNEWNIGWIIFSNPKCDNNAADATAELLKMFAGDPSGASMVPENTQRSVRFDNRGMSSLSNANTINLAPPGGTPTKSVCLSSAGRARIVNYMNGCS